MSGVTHYNVMRARSGTHHFKPDESVYLKRPLGAVHAARQWADENPAVAGERILLIPVDPTNIGEAFLFMVGSPPPKPPLPVAPDTGRGQ